MVDTSRIRAWTIQPWHVWEEVNSGRSLTVDWRYSANLHPCYDWLREQLCWRVSGYQGHYPWWAYGERPDLRFHRHQEPEGQAFALLQLELPRSTVAVLPFWAWDLIFQHRFVDIDRRKAAKWERRMRKAVVDEELWPLPEPWRSELYSSWERIFDPAFPRRGWASPFGRPVESVDVVFEVLDRPAVKKVTRFLGSCRNRQPREVCDFIEHLDGPTTNHR